jgi:hypothetical protein
LFNVRTLAHSASKLTPSIASACQPYCTITSSLAPVAVVSALRRSARQEMSRT